MKKILHSLFKATVVVVFLSLSMNLYPCTIIAVGKKVSAPRLVNILLNQSGHRYNREYT